MLYPIISLVIGLIVLVWSADKFVFGAASTAKNFGMSPLLIGLTIVSFGTSAPEILVSIMATLDDSGTLAIGNAIGSNIANIALVLGVTALIAPLPVKETVRRKEMPLMLAVTVIAGALLFNLRLELLDSIILFAALIISLILFARFQQDMHEHEDDEIPAMSTAKSLFWLVLGLILLVASSKALVWGATEIATALGVSDLVIGLTIVAIGTSLPELAASVVSALKGHHDIAIGNVIGSNIFNIGAVMTIPGLAAPVILDGEVFSRDFMLMLALSALLLAFCFMRKPAAIKRVEGAVLLSIYSGYMLVLYLSAA
ncbi:MAG: calcium/sodium antiporter [Oceanospirillaceae bacterium]|nr:calcium/sodium antiporter [Oceanospirillaceae bacterium]